MTSPLPALHSFVCWAFLIWVSASASAQDRRLSVDTIFDPAHLAEVVIELPPADWEALCASTRTFAESLGKAPLPSPFRYFKGSITIDGVRIENVGIRKKAFGSMDRHRPSLKIKFDEFQKQAPADGFDRLTLNNNKQDGSQVSQTLAYKIFRETGAPASRCNHAEVTVNGTMLGIYSNVESVRSPMLKRSFGDASGRLFEGTIADFFELIIAKVLGGKNRPLR